MGDITFRTIVSFLHHSHGNEEAIMLKNIITPELLYYINTPLLGCLPFLQRQDYLLVYGFTGSHAPRQYVPAAQKINAKP